jgi:hypothetical protein
MTTERQNMPHANVALGYQGAGGVALHKNVWPMALKKSSRTAATAKNGMETS